MITSEKRRVYQILEEMEVTKQKFSQTNYDWLCRKFDPPYKDLFTKIFVSKEEMFKSFEHWRKTKSSDVEEEILPKTIEDVENELEVNSIDMNKVSDFLLGRKDIQTNSAEIEKLKLLLDNTSKTGNTFLNMMVYKQIERVARLVSALEVAETRMYSTSVIETVSPRALVEIIDNINKTLKFTLEFIDKVSNRELKEKMKGANITINQTTINNSTSPDPVASNTSLSKPARESIRLLAEKLLNSSTSNDKAADE